MEKNPKNSKEIDESLEEGGESMKTWLQENMRMLVSIVIVVAIAGGIYAYSKRTQPQVAQKETMETTEDAEGKISVIGGDTVKEEQVAGETTTDSEEAAVQAPQPAEEVPTASREFSKNSIAQAIEKSKTLTEGQLKNLEKYSQRVPELK